MAAKPVVTIIAGPNGSGKSTLTAQLRSLVDLGHYINPDDIDRQLPGPPGLERSRQAQAEAAAMREQCLEERRSFTFETVMSHESKVELLQRARSLGYRLVMYYVALESAELSHRRVEQRVKLGGHPVPADRIEPRYRRSLALLPRAIAQCDRVVLFDNSYRDRIDQPVIMKPFCEIRRRRGKPGQPDDFDYLTPDGARLRPEPGYNIPLWAASLFPEPEREIVFKFATSSIVSEMPIAAAMITVGEGEPYIECANDHFRFLAEWDERLGERHIAQVPLLRTGPVGTRLITFLQDGESAHQFETADGRSIGGRHFTVRFVQLKVMDGQPRRCLITLIDRTAQVETEKSLRSEMLRDTLTGLPNRFAFNEKVDAVLADPAFREGGYAVLAVDMTRFNRVNECLGTLAGDELLITFARRLVSALRPTDMLARTSGDEFGILVPLDCGLNDALRAAERIKAVLTLPFRLSDLEIRVDCAIGCALLNQGVGSADEVLRNAQFALKRAKTSGTTEVYEPIHAQAVQRRFSMETELRVAIESEALTLAYQPLIELETGRVAGFEALARWEHDGALISPSQFIPVAEESGLIVQLGRWALETATRTMGEWDRQVGRELPLNMSVNLSPVQISRDDIPAAVSSALAAAGIAGNRLTLELTEGAIIDDPDRVAKVLNALKRFDVRIAMDDFGTGFTSLASLQKMPIDVLKIDQSFVSGMLADSDSTAIVRAILSLARALGMETTAEGIDGSDLAEMLSEAGCTYGQGFFYAEGLAADQALAYWLSRSA